MINFSIISVVGAGTMGNGIAHVFAQNGFKVTIIDISLTQLDKALANISKNFDRQIARVTARIVELSRQLGKVPCVVNDYPGFVANRILMPMINEAIYTLYEGVAGVEEIDTVMKLGMAHPMGPLQLADFIGLDVCLSILNVLHQALAIRSMPLVLCW